MRFVPRYAFRKTRRRTVSYKPKAYFAAARRVGLLSLLIRHRPIALSVYRKSSAEIPLSGTISVERCIAATAFCAIVHVSEVGFAHVRYGFDFPESIQYRLLG